MKLAWENSDTGYLGASYMPKNVIVQDTETRESGPDFTNGYGEDVSVPREPQPSDQVFRTDQKSTEAVPFLRQLMPSEQAAPEDAQDKAAELLKQYRGTAPYPKIIKPKRDAEGHMLLIQSKAMRKSLSKSHRPEYQEVWSKQKTAYEAGVTLARSTYGV